MAKEEPAATRARFLALLKRAFDGWQNKIANDFSAQSFERELVKLQSDSVYRSFGLAVPEYVLIRLMGRVSISIGRRLGELYDNLPKYVAAARYDLDPSDVAAKIDGLNLDVCIPYGKLSNEDVEHAKNCAKAAIGEYPDNAKGLGIEIRYNFNPNDSARLRKDVAMADGLLDRGLVPVYLVYSGISPRDEAIKRLSGAGWTFLIGEEAAHFTQDLLGLDLAALLDEPQVRTTVSEGVDRMMATMIGSSAFAAALSSGRRRLDHRDTRG